MSLRLASAAALLAATATLAADPPASGGSHMTVAYFSELQEAPPSTPEEMAEKLKGRPDGDEAAAAESALNEWKLCVLDSLVRWGGLSEGPGTLIDGAYGRCGDLERQYRSHLTKIAQNGRTMIDLSFARSMLKSMEDAWRPRLTAAALDQMVQKKEAEKAGGKDSRGK